MKSSFFFLFRREARGAGRIALGLGALIVLLALFSGAMAAQAAPTGQSDPKTAPQAPQAGCAPGGQCFADVFPNNPFYGNINSLYANDVVSGYSCGAYPEYCDQYGRPYYRPGAFVTRAQMAKFVDLARRQPGINIDTPTGGIPIYVRTTAGGGTAVYALAPNGVALRGDGSRGDLAAIFGNNTNVGYGVQGRSNGTAIRGESAGDGDGVSGQSGAAGRNGVYGINTSSGTGVFGISTNGGDGVVGQSGTQNHSGVYGLNTGNGYGVFGRGNGNGQGIYGESQGSNAVEGHSFSSTSSGVYGLNLSGGFGVAGRSNGNAERAGIFGENVGSGNAGYFVGHVIVTGGCCLAAAGTFRMDDPADPANKYLYSSAVASPDMLNIYNGNVTTDDKGLATVQLPSYFETLNGDFRYQLTAIDKFAQLIIASKIKDNSFTIKSDQPNVEVSWQVTGIRKDAYAQQNRTPTEVDKPANERGYFLNPQLYGAPTTQRVEESLRH